MESARNFFSKLQEQICLEDIDSNILLKIFCESLLLVVDDFESQSIALPLDLKSKGLTNLEKKVVKSFEVDSPPKLNIEEYMMRIVQLATPENSTIILTFIFLDKLLNTGKLQLKKSNIHKLCMSAFYCAVKYNEDVICKFNSYSKIFSVPNESLIELEYCFSELIEYKFYVENERYINYVKSVLKYYEKTVRIAKAKSL